MTPKTSISRRKKLHLNEEGSGGNHSPRYNIMLYVDTPIRVALDSKRAPYCFRGQLAAHLIADTEQELVAYAVSIGMRPRWLQHPGTRLAHFDLTGSRLARVLRDTAVRKLTRAEMVRRMTEPE